MKFLFPFFLFFTFSCSKPQLPEQIQNQVVVVAETVPIVDHSEKKVKRYIKYYMNQVDKMAMDSILSVRLFSSQLLPEMYKFSAYKPLWMDEKNLEDAIYAIQHSVEDGLLPEDYHWNEIYDLFNELIVADTIRFEKLAKLDILLTDGIIFYAFHLLRGKVNPESLDANWNYAAKAIPKDALALFSNAINNKKILNELNTFRPSSQQYHILLHEYRRLAEQDTSEWRPLTLNVKKIQIDDKVDIISDIRNRLIQLGDLKTYEFDDPNIYDVTLEEGVRSFQMRHGLYPDGEIGKATIEMMNLSLEKRLQQLAVNMERLRWSQGEELDNTIYVNIATFNLKLYRNGEVVHRNNVVTGKPYHKTPVFKSRMEYIEFNPTWTVPYSIATNELLPSIKKNKNYLANNNMELLTHDGRLLNPDEINFSDFSRSNFPYIIRQKAGSKNALGVVKFIFPNKYSVYLHDTQSKSLFQKTSRAFSHGCIRVEHPLKLAEVILNDSIEWNMENINALVNSKKTTRVNLKYNLTVMIQYYTAGQFNISNVFYFPDIYDRDGAVYSVLKQPFSPSEISHQKLQEQIEFPKVTDTLGFDFNAL